ncbi:MAG: glycosyltransferase family 2 protein [Anaerolinea sp.]|nr:glycosyltransferase family 2 protein [Anaerolinea sp.]
MMPTVSILILNYNSMAHLQANLDALTRLDYPADRLEILLVDNASSDGSVAWVAAHYPAVRLVQNGANLGFAAGNNAGAAAATGEWLAILNPDIRVRPDWLTEMIRPTQQDPGVTAVAAKMLNWEGTAVDFADAAINFMGWGNQPGLGSAQLAQFDTAKPLLFPCGGAMLIRRDLFLESGGFDPDYFAYFEDVDLGWRLWLLGHKVMYAPRAIVYHRHHGSWQSVASAKVWLLSERNTLLTLLKNYGDANLASILPAALLLTLQRAFLDAQPDPTHFGLPAAPMITPWRYYAYELWQLLRYGRLLELLQRAFAELHRRLRRTGPPPIKLPQAWQQPTADGRFQMPDIALSRLLAGRDVLRQWDAALSKRAAVQARRRRRDQEIFPLFQQPLLSNFGDAQFIYAMNQVIAKFKLVKLFAGHKKWAPPSPDVQALSLALSRRLLRLMDEAFALSQADEDAFRLTGAAPQPVYAVPHRCAALLAHANHWLWKLPDGDLRTVLTYLQQQIDQWEEGYHDDNQS